MSRCFAYVLSSGNFYCKFLVGGSPVDVRSSPPANRLEDSWPVSRRCLEPRLFVGDPTSLARDKIYVFRCGSNLFPIRFPNMLCYFSGGALCAGLNIDLSIHLSIFYKNSAGGACAAVQLSQNTTASFFNCSFIDNKAPGGSALTAAFNVSIALNKCTFRGNIATEHSMIYLRRLVTLHANETVIENNDGHNSPLIQTVEKKTSVHFEKSRIVNNTGRGILSLHCIW